MSSDLTHVVLPLTVWLKETKPILLPFMLFLIAENSSSLAAVSSETQNTMSNTKTIER